MVTMTFAATAMELGVGFLGAAVGAGLAAIGAGIGIGMIGSNSVQAVARQPEASGDIFKNMLLTAAFVEGTALFACAICFLLMGNVNDAVTKIIGG